MHHWRTARTPGGESYADLYARVSAWHDATLWPPARPLVIVGHHGSLRALWSILHQMPAEEAMAVKWDYGQVRSIDATRREA